MPVGKEGVHCVSPLPLLVVLPLVVRPLCELSWLVLGLLVSVLYHFSKLLRFDFINSCIGIAGKAYFMHSPWILLCLGREFPFLMTLLLVRQPGNGTLQVVIFVGDLIMHIVYFLVE